jgi:hypothetical protein
MSLLEMGRTKLMSYVYHSFVRCQAKCCPLQRKKRVSTCDCLHRSALIIVGESHIQIRGHQCHRAVLKAVHCNATPRWGVDFITLEDDGIGTFPTLSGPAADQSATRTKKRLTAVVLTITDADADQLKAVWGPATEITDSGTPTSVWLNTEDKIRAMMVPGAKMLTIQPYLPSKWILGAPGKPLGIEDKRPLIGLSAAELQADYPDFCNKCSDESLSFMSWNPDEFGNLFKMELGMNAGKVESLQYWISFGANPTVKAEKKAEIEAKYGVAKEVKTDLGPKLVLSEKPKVTIAELEDSWVIGIAK